MTKNKKLKRVIEKEPSTGRKVVKEFGIVLLCLGILSLVGLLVVAPERNATLGRSINSKRSYEIDVKHLQCFLGSSDNNYYHQNYNIK